MLIEKETVDYKELEELLAKHRKDLVPAVAA